MRGYKTKNLRNVGIVGHSGSGKTTLVEAMLYCTHMIDRMGKIEDGNTVSDYDLEEKERKISISTSIIPCKVNNIKINLIDMPGYFDFVGEILQGLRATDVAMITVSGVSSVEVGTENVWNYIEEYKLPRAFYINKLDRENSNFEKVLKDLKEKFGLSVVPVQYPVGKENEFNGVINVISEKARIFNSKTNKMEEKDIPKELMNKIKECKNMIIEAVAETDEILLEKYFENGTLSNQEIINGLIKGCALGEISPVMCGAASKGIGIETLLEDIIECFPSPEHTSAKKVKNLQNSEIVNMKINENEGLSATVFKTIADPFVGKLSLFKVITGKMQSDSMIYNSNKQKYEKINKIYFLRGKEQIETKEVHAGDIGAIPKLQFTSTGDTLCDKSNPMIFESIEFPDPVISMAILSNLDSKDEDKISLGLNKLLEEDPTFKISRDVENAEIIISGLGETHIDVLASKLKNKFGIKIDLRVPKVQYRETIKEVADVEGKYKKQSGGHGQYGDVKIKFEPRYDGDDLEFINEIVGGVIPKQYIPAVEKGLKKCMEKGVLANYPVIRLKATLYDGSYHSVDSSEMAFKVAASLAYKKGLKQANPVLLEPIMEVEILTPEEYMGDIMGDINKKRGKVLGMENHKRLQKIMAEIPQAEMFKYATELRSITQARAQFKMKFKKYEEVPSCEAEKIISEINEE